MRSHQLARQICNYPEKLIPALRSRCTEFRYPRLPEAGARAFPERVAAAEGLQYTPDGLQALLDLGIGDLQRSLDLMQTTSLATDVKGNERLPVRRIPFSGRDPAGPTNMTQSTVRRMCGGSRSSVEREG
jgi:DNA polymerase III delta prime subunit